MPIKPPVVERAIACRYPRIEPEAFRSVRKRWQPIMADQGFTETVVKHWDIKIPADSMESPDLANSTMALREAFQYRKDLNTILQPCQDLFSVNLLGADNTSFDQAAQLAGQFIPQWLELASITQPQTVELIYVNDFNETHFTPFILESGELNLVGVFKLPVFSPFSDGVFVGPLSQHYTWKRKESPNVHFAVTLELSSEKPNKYFAKLVQKATQTLERNDHTLEHHLKLVLRELHNMHSESFKGMLTPEMLSHCGIERNGLLEVEK